MELAIILTLFLSFFIMLAIGIPISLSVALASFFSLLHLFPASSAALITAQKMLNALDNFGLLAIPFFILAGNIMNTGGIAIRLINLSRLFTGKLPGGLSHTNILANTLFGAISGSAASSAAAIGSIMSPIQRKENYDMNLAAAVNITSCTAGLLIPPSNVLILYSLVSGGTSIAALFVAGYLPGFLLCFSLMLITAYMSRKNKVVSSQKIEKLKVIWEALPSLFLIILVIGGIIAGVFTATEASGIAVLYSLILSFCYKMMDREKLFHVLIQSAKASSIVLFLVSSSSVMSWVMAMANVPQFISEFLLSFSDSPWVVLISINIILLVVGTFLDFTPAVLIFTPIFLPVTESLGIDPVHFGIIMIFNLSIGICTPPVGNALFIGCSVANVKIHHVVSKLLPLYAILILDLLIVVLWPNLSLWLPKVFGLL
ncbi:MAG: hypothetical protein CME62_15630 [Halobacteriovoraceae bacterium]|nr:hypothetical protein [Halobacteriovoraceae bacterium]|tara:strand:- start:2700 stop:3989 length:1290 start_codon:yes stop_codon:yes gene_type:complete